MAIFVKKHVCWQDLLLSGSRPWDPSYNYFQYSLGVEVALFPNWQRGSMVDWLSEEVCGLVCFCKECYGCGWLVWLTVSLFIWVMCDFFPIRLVRPLNAPLMELRKWLYYNCMRYTHSSAFKTIENIATLDFLVDFLEAFKAPILLCEFSMILREGRDKLGWVPLSIVSVAHLRPTIFMLLFVSF